MVDSATVCRLLVVGPKLNGSLGATTREHRTGLQDFLGAELLVILWAQSSRLCVAIFKASKYGSPFGVRSRIQIYLGSMNNK